MTPPNAPAPTNNTANGIDRADLRFVAFLWILGGAYVALVMATVLAHASYTMPGHIINVLSQPAVRSSILLTLTSCTSASLAALAVATPLGYLMSRGRFAGRGALEAVLDIPNVLPPLVLGLSLLILFQCGPFRYLSGWVVYQVPAVFLTQFVVATACALPIIRSAFDHTSARTEAVALTLGCSRRQAFLWVTLPEVRYGLLAAGAMGWARCFGSFGPLLVFAGATRHKTEVLSTTVFLELSVGHIEGAVAASILMILIAGLVLTMARLFSLRQSAFTRMAT